MVRDPEPLGALKMKAFILALFLAGRIAIAAEAPLAPILAIQDCVRQSVNLNESKSRDVYLKCALPQFAAETRHGIAERLALWFATAPDLENLKICTSKQRKTSGDRYHSEAAACFELLDGESLKHGYIFLRHSPSGWRVIDVKY